VLQLLFGAIVVATSLLPALGAATTLTGILDQRLMLFRLRRIINRPGVGEQPFELRKCLGAKEQNWRFVIKSRAACAAQSDRRAIQQCFSLKNCLSTHFCIRLLFDFVSRSAVAKGPGAWSAKSSHAFLCSLLVRPPSLVPTLKLLSHFSAANSFKVLFTTWKEWGWS